MAESTPNPCLSDPVTAQYERWTYPPPHTDLESLPLTGPQSNFKDFRALHLAYWPTQPYQEGKDILVAGCGTMAAACYAYLYPQARVVGIDLSAASLTHEQFLKDKYRLSNLSLHRPPLEEVAAFARKLAAGSEREAALRTVTQALAYQAPQQATEWAHSLSGDEQKAAHEWLYGVGLPDNMRQELEQALQRP